MADINIERKGASVWPWVVGLLLLAVVVFVVLQYFRGDKDATVVVPVDSTISQPQYQPAPLPPVTDSLGAGTSTDSVPATTTSSL